MPKDPGVIFKQSEAQRTQHVVEFVEQTMLPPKGRDGGRGKGFPGLLKDAELTATLTVATDSKTGSSTASAKFLVADPDNDGDLKDGDAFTVTNRSVDASGVSGDYIIVARVAGEWRLIWIDC